MNAEIISVGTELLMGQIADSDAQMLSRELQSLGIAVYHHQVVGDNPQRMREALALALSYMESFFPLALIVPLPGVKLGLANIVTLYALYALGFPSALAILLVRCTLGALFAGNASALLFSLLGGLGASGDGAFEQDKKAQHFRRLDRGRGGAQLRAGLRRAHHARLDRAALLSAVLAAGVALHGRAQRPDHCILVPRNGAHALRNEGRESTWIKRTRSFSSSSTSSAR